MKYFRQYVEDIQNNKPPTQITQKEAINGLRGFYQNPNEVIDSTTQEHKVRTPFAFYWKEIGGKHESRIKHKQ